VRFPDTVTILRTSGTDEYGNPERGWAAPTESTAQAFVVTVSRISNGERVPGWKGYFPPGTDIRHGDRLRTADGAVYDVHTPTPARSPGRTVLVTAGLSRKD
jgi:hypothetical protein